jgi:ankyrin repeat protein
MVAISMNLKDIAIKLIHSGVNPENTNDSNRTALILACISKQRDVALELIKTGQSNPGAVAGDSRVTALIAACIAGLKDVALELIKTGQSNPGAAVNNGPTALIIACYKRIPDIALELIKTGQSNPGVVHNGYTALIYACRNNMTKIVFELIKTGQSNPGAILNRIENGTVIRTNALDITCRYGNIIIATMLLKTGKSIVETDTGISIAKHAIELADERNWKEVVAAIEKEVERIENGPTVNLNDTGYSFATMDDVKIKDWITQKGNICLLVDKKYYLTDKNTIKNQTLDNTQIKYECRKSGTTLPYLQDSNIIFDKKYFSLSFIGLQFVTPFDKDELDAFMESEHQIYRYSWDGIVLNGIASDSYLYDVTGAISADHCQPGKKTYVYKISKLKTTVEIPLIESIPIPIETQSEKFKVQYSGQIFEFEVKLDMTLEDIKQLILEKLVADGIEQKSEIKGFIYRGTLYPDTKFSDTKLTDVEPNPVPITLQTLIRKKSSYGGTKRKKKPLRKYTRRV